MIQFFYNTELWKNSFGTVLCVDVYTDKHLVYSIIIIMPS